MTTLNIETIDELGKFLQMPSKKTAWLKIDKNSKKKLVSEFVDNVLVQEHSLSTEDSLKCKKLLIDLIHKKKLSKAKDIIFNIEEVRIEKIPCLLYTNGEFCVIAEKRPSTSKSLPNMKTFVKSRSIKSSLHKPKISFGAEETPGPEVTSGPEKTPAPEVTSGPINKN